MRNSAVAGIEPAKGETAWGVLYELTPEDLRRLDRVEGYAEGRDAAENTAQRIGVRVERTDGLTVEAETHVAVAVADPGTPREGYLFLLARAAKALEFPDDYVAKLGGTKPEKLAA